MNLIARFSVLICSLFTPETAFLGRNLHLPVQHIAGGSCHKEVDNKQVIVDWIDLSSTNIDVSKKYVTYE